MVVGTIAYSGGGAASQSMGFELVDKFQKPV
jgi:hypothetical protein